MAVVQLRDIVTDEDRARALAVQRGPGQEHYVASVEKSFADAIESPEAAPRYWTVNDGDEVVGFVMISDGVPAGEIEADPTLIGPYFLWRLLIDERHQRQGYGTATLDALVAYLRDRPGAIELYTSCVPGDGTPQPFYERYGFVPTGRIEEDEVVLRLDLPRGDR
ncbi:MAG: GNAT family N-acetyltransferase [Chloroflexi bacterium]|nr:GNAT family N-acetyltransferase [Chloroflexota bacterium]